MDIKKLDRKALKSFFVKNAIPTEGNFKDLIDGMINQKDDGIVKLPDEPLSLQADGNATSQKKVINFYGSFADRKPAWTLSLNPYVDPNNPATAKPGWSIGDADGNSRLFIDQSTGNVGIGTLDPKQSLDVNGNIAIQGGAYILSPGRMHIKAEELLFLFSKSGVVVDKRWSGGNGNLIVEGSVGIGTSNPSRKLSISLENQGDGILLDSGSNGKAVALFTNNTQGAWNGLTQPGDHLLLWKGQAVDDPGAGLVIAPWRNSASGIRIDANGNVGIGTSDPKYSFEIKASSGIKLGVEGSGGGQLIIANNKDDNRIYLEAFSSDATGHASELLLTGRHGGNVPKLSFLADLTAVSGNVVVNGNVGIGASDPKGKLDVNGMVRITSWFNADKDPDSGMTCGGGLVIKSNAPQIDFIDTEHNDWSIHVDSNKMYFIRQPWIYSDLVLDGAGSVGIGTDNPKGKLEVNGVAVISNGNCNAAALGYMASGSLTVGGITTSYGGGQGWTSNTAGLLFETAANTEIVVHDSGTRLASLMYYEGDAANRITIGRDMGPGWGAIAQVVLNGKVGIGTSDPQYSFEIKASSSIKLGLEGYGGGQLILANNKDDNRIYLEAFSSDATGHASELLLTGRHGGNVPKLSFFADLTAVSGNVVVNGNVGIGTSYPKSTLEVNGDVGTGTLRAKAMRVTHHVANVKTGVGLSAGSWLDFPELVVSFQLGGDADVNVFYGIAILGVAPFTSTPVGYLCTRLNLDGHELPETRCATGQSDFMAVSSVWVGTLASGSHTFKVEYFAEKPMWLQLSYGEKGTLMVTVYGVG